MKAVTPVIALVMLLLITVGIAGASYTWFGGLVSSSTKKSITIPPGGAYCSDGDIKVYVLNDGDTAITANDIIVAQVDGVDVKNTPFFGDMRSGLVGYWKFDEASGPAKDSSGVAPPNDGTLAGNPQRVAGRSRNALQFDGIEGNDGVMVGDSDSHIFGTINAGTVMMWLNPASYKSSSNAPSKWFGKIGGTTDLNLMFGGATGTVAADVWSTTITGTTIIPLNQWTHYALTWSPSGIKIYLNGVQVESSATAVNAVMSTENLYIGRKRTGYNFNGIIDEVKTYNRAAGDVNIQPGKSGLIASYPGVESRHTIKIVTSSNAAEASVTC